MKKRIISSFLTVALMVSTMMFWTISASAVDMMNIGEGVYTIYSKLNSRMVLDISGGSTASGGNLQLYQYNSTFTVVLDSKVRFLLYDYSHVFWNGA